VIWAILFFFGLIRFKFQWLLVCATALALSATNLIGYYKCSSTQKERMANLMQSGTATLFATAATSMGGKMMGMFSGGDARGAHQPLPNNEL
jgi:hypothetical protein